MKLKIGKSGYVLLPPDILEALGLSHSVGGTVEFHLHDGSVVLGKSLAPPVCSNKECAKPLADRAICQDCKRLYAESYHRKANVEAATRLLARTQPSLG